MAMHHLEPGPAFVTDVYSRETDAVLTIGSGDRLTVRTLNSRGHLERQQVPGEARPLMFPAMRGHCLAGPIAVRGARPGQVLAIEFHSLQTDDWGLTSAGGRDTSLYQRLGTATLEPANLLWSIDRESGFATNQHKIRVPLAPFLGITGVAPHANGEYSTIPPRTKGAGNIDCKELVAGSTLYIPVVVPEAYLYFGDGHAAQGDGEVGGNAIETGMTTDVTVRLLDTAALDCVHALTPNGRVTFGFDENLNVAMGDALSAMITWMESLFDLDRAAALALASSAVDLRITQVANETWGVHALLSPHVGLAS